MKWARVKDFSGLETETTTDMKIQTPQGLSTLGKVLSSFMNSYFKEKVTRRKSRTSQDLQQSLQYTKGYVSQHGTHPDHQEISFKNVDLSQIQSHIRGLKNTNAVGVDGISIELVKKFCNILTPAILHIVNLSLTQPSQFTQRFEE